MKREQIILAELSDAQLGHARNLLDKELKRRSSAPPKKSARVRSRTAKR